MNPVIKRAPRLNRFLKKRAHKIGLPPGSLVLPRDGKADPVHLSLTAYNAEQLEEQVLNAPEEITRFREQSAVHWLNVDGVHQLDLIGQIGALYEVHPLVLEDIVHTDQRPNGYPVALLAMVGIGTALAFYFKWKKWF